MRNRMKALTQEVVGLGWGSFTQLFRSKGIRGMNMYILYCCVRCGEGYFITNHVYLVCACMSVFSFTFCAFDARLSFFFYILLYFSITLHVNAICLVLRIIPIRVV